MTRPRGGFVAGSRPFSGDDAQRADGAGAVEGFPDAPPCSDLVRMAVELDNEVPTVSVAELFRDDMGLKSEHVERVPAEVVARG